MRSSRARLTDRWLVWGIQSGLEKKTLKSTWKLKSQISVIHFLFWSCRTIFSFHALLLLVRTHYLLRYTAQWPVSLFCVLQSYFIPHSDFLRIFLLLKILSFCFSSEYLLPPHHQMNLALDNSKYLLFSSPSHTCPHSTSHTWCLPTFIPSWKTTSSYCNKTFYFFPFWGGW